MARNFRWLFRENGDKVNIKILEQRATIRNNQILEYFVDIDLSFIIDENR